MTSYDSFDAEREWRAKIIDFVRESNRIEGITRRPSRAEIAATEEFLQLHKPSVPSVERLVDVYQPGAKLRLRPNLNVRVGDHIAPQGGPEIGAALASILEDLASNDPWKTHVRYETLHPFTDGNGRSGRAIWAWQMVRFSPGHGLSLGFLHRFYYQTLSASRVDQPAAREV